ncbi:MAG TPA: heme-binding protein [Terriglobales bacterium]|nr:heme-binding protein [Terriglobales bacterium]
MRDLASLVPCMRTAQHRRLLIFLGVLALGCVAIILQACGGSATTPATPSTSPAAPLSASEVDTIVQNAVLSVNVPIVVAVTDRTGAILAVFETPGAPATATGNFGAVVDSHELAVSLARTAALFSNDQAPLSSRTVRFISGIHFPPGVSFAPNADLYGIENTNRGCPLNATFNPGKTISPSRSVNGANVGLGITTGRVDVMDSDPTAVNPGGVPLFKGGHAVGGIGVVSSSASVSEFAAFSGASQSGFLPTASQLPPPGVVIIGGISLPFVNQTVMPPGVAAGSAGGSYVFGPMAGGLPPEGDLVGPNGGVGGLTQSDVAAIVSQAVTTADLTRAVIRLPSGSRTHMTIAVADLDGTVLALHRMPDATVFSIDVAVAKARNVIYFSSTGSSDLSGVPAGTAVTNRTIGFAAQPLFPPGIDGSNPGPFFTLYTQDLANPCTQGSQALNSNQSGIVFFPGSLPLYKNGVLVGGLGVSGDGVDQDDYVTSAGANGFEAPANIHADQVIIDTVRLPYLKFPRNPTN